MSPLIRASRCYIRLHAPRLPHNATIFMPRPPLVTSLAAAAIRATRAALPLYTIYVMRRKAATITARIKYAPKK